MRLAEDVTEIGQIESPPLLDGRNMVMVLGPTKNAGVTKSDAKTEDTQRSEEEVQDQRDGEDPAAQAAPDDASGAPGEEPREAEALPAERAARA
jgi:translation initiation factor IF-3